MKLIGSLDNPYARKVRIILAEKKIECAQEDHPDDELAQVIAALPDGPAGKLPVLALDDGTLLFDDRVLTEYIDNLSPNKKLLPAANRERAMVNRWEAAANALIVATMKTLARKGERAREARENIARTLDFLEQDLGKRPFCVGNALSMADLSLGAALDYLRLSCPEDGWGEDWSERYPALSSLYAQLVTRPSFVETLPPDGTLPNVSKKVARKVVGEKTK
ncbi:MAG: glutathione S-transferase family protein [Zoogloeaceae bacterium]|jgi:glutathione S-transferase|nr:glutathione S-transferase family protein [Zoogloeaceae bacterium]